MTSHGLVSMEHVNDMMDDEGVSMKHVDDVTGDRSVRMKNADNMMDLP